MTTHTRHLISATLATAMAFGVANPIAVTLPPEIKQIVGFVYVANEMGEFVPNGTGFLVSIPFPENKDEGRR